MFRLLFVLALGIVTLSLPPPVQAQPGCPQTSNEPFVLPVVTSPPPPGAVNPRPARIDPEGVGMLYDYPVAPFSYVFWTPRFGFAYVQIGGATLSPPGANGTAIRLGSPCDIVLLVGQPNGAINRGAAVKACYSILDFSVFSAEFGRRGAGLRFDLNRDGVVDLRDLSLFGAGLCR